MTQIIRLKGTEDRLYQLVAPLVMNPEVLKQNNNYPFRTSESFVWYVAMKKTEVLGFIPLEYKKHMAVINNYYIKDNVAEVLKALLEKVIADMDTGKRLGSVTLIGHRDLFKEAGFTVEKEWKLYVKMIKEK